MLAHSLETERLSKRFGRKVAVDNISLKVPSGVILGFLGLNGAGKTTTIRMLASLLAPSSGRVAVLGADPQIDATRVRARIGLVSESDAGTSRPTWTPLEYLAYFATLHGRRLSALQLHDRLAQLRVDPEFRGRQMRELSTGTRRRVEIARALLGNPRVLFLDEPSRGLDLPAKRELWLLLRHLVQRDALTVFLSSHDALEIQGLCDRIIVVATGRVAFDGTPATLGTGAAFEANLIRLLQGASTASAVQPARAPTPVRGGRLRKSP